MTALTIDKLTHIISNELNQEGDEYKVFVESGTYLGETIIQLQPYFETLYTVELSEEYFQNFDNFLIRIELYQEDFKKLMLMNQIMKILLRF